MKILKIILPFLIITLLFSNISARDIWALKINGIINPVSASYISHYIETAQDEDVECIIIQLDTPGGLMTSMKIIIKKIMNSNVPIIVFVGPQGAQAGSAGVFITMSSHIAIMAPGTNIGAAHPVNIGGSFGKKADSLDTSTMNEKITNDAISYIRSLTHQRNRNEKWAEESVRHSISITNNEALKKNVIEFIAKDIDDVLLKIDGQTVETESKTIVLSTKDKTIIHKPYGFHREILDIISHPNVAYILMILGFWGIVFEIKNPGMIFPGVVGGVCLILAFFSFQILPINLAGIALILGSLILFILEVYITSFGLLTIGGVSLMIIGSMMLIDYTIAPKALFAISLNVIIPIVVFTAAFFIFAFSMALKAHKIQVTTGVEGLINKVGKAITDISKSGGKVMVHGEIWNAVSEEEIPNNSDIIVKKIENMNLYITKKMEE